MAKCIVNVSIGSDTSWYHKGQSRLRESINAVDKSNQYFLKYEHPTLKSVYEDKILTIKKAIDAGWEKMLWLDCSIIAIKPLDDIWKYLDERGYYLYGSGDNCAVTCNDNCLNLYGVSRDWADTIREVATNVVGINLEHDAGRNFWNKWESSLNNNSNIGKKWHESDDSRKSESSDPRFKYHRQDQSTASLSAGLLGLEIEKEGHFVVRKENECILKNDQTIFILQGGF